jgi:hypothetical protein
LILLGRRNILSDSKMIAKRLSFTCATQVTADLGEHGPECWFANNVGCPMTV